MSGHCGATKKYRANGVTMMHWTVILSALAAATTSAYLVFAHGWDATLAFSTVGVGGMVAVVGLLAVVMLLAGPVERPKILRYMRATMCRDFDDALRWFRIKR